MEKSGKVPARFFKKEKIDVSIMFKNVGAKNFSPLHFSSLSFVPIFRP